MWDPKWKIEKFFGFKNNTKSLTQLLSYRVTKIMSVSFSEDIWREDKSLSSKYNLQDLIFAVEQRIVYDLMT